MLDTVNQLGEVLARHEMRFDHSRGPNLSWAYPHIITQKPVGYPHLPGYCVGSAKQPTLPPAVDNQRDCYKGERTREPKNVAGTIDDGLRGRSPPPNDQLRMRHAQSRGNRPSYKRPYPAIRTRCLASFGKLLYAQTVGLRRSWRNSFDDGYGDETGYSLGSVS